MSAKIQEASTRNPVGILPRGISALDIDPEIPLEIYPNIPSEIHLRSPLRIPSCIFFLKFQIFQELL